MSEDDELGAGEAAAFLRISTDTLARWGDLGRIRYTRLASGRRRYRRADLEQARTVVEPTNPPAAGDG